MIQLHRCKQDNPFDRFPELRTIWPEPHLQALAEQATIETLDAQTVPGTPDRGPIFLILNIDAAGHERVVGISGYYTLDDRAEQLGLRWHGIVPRARGHGFSRLAFEQVLQTIRTSLPNAREITEIVPLIERGEHIARHFQRLGFTPRGEPKLYDWAPHAWQCWGRALDFKS
jgi:hypothetical protein